MSVVTPVRAPNPNVFACAAVPRQGANRRPRRHAAYLKGVLGSPDDPRKPLHLTWFAGGGGSSCGFKAATWRDPDYALNHDAVALRMHEVNHPSTIHLCADAFGASPLDIEPGRRIDSMWFSPDCRHYSKARGAAPKSKRIRGLCWAMIPWATLRRPNVIFFENVEEFRGAGPLFPEGHPRAGQPDPARTGETFARLGRRMAQLGYVCEWRELVIADYGGETTRKRLFGIFRCDGEPIVWPARTHAPRDKAEKLGLEPWVGAASFIDFELPCPSIFMTQDEAKAEGLKVKRPLVGATHRRIFKGIERYVIRTAEPFIVPITNRSNPNGTRSAADPIRTVTAAKGGEFALASPLLSHAGAFLFGCGGRRGQSPEISVDRPAPTGTGKADTWLCMPYLVPHHGERAGQDPRTLSPLRPYPAATPGRASGSLVAPILIRTDMTGAKFSGVYSSREPMRTATGAGGFAVSSAFLTRQFGTSSARSLRDAHPTVMTEAAGAKSGIAAVSLTTYYATGIGSDCADPLRTATGEDRHGVVAAFMEQANTGMVGHAATEPVSTIVGRGTTQRLIQARLQAFGVEPGSRRAQVLDFLWEHAGAPTDAEWADPLATEEGRLKFGLVVIAGEVWEIADIGMRMLTVRELFRAQTFPKDYIIDRDIKGRPITGTQATLMCGNAVPPLMAKLLYQLNLPKAVPEQAVAA